MTYYKINSYERPVCSVSGGADSDMMVDIVTKCDPTKKVRYIFFDTGLEYRATKDHLQHLESKYDITIERIKPKMAIPTTCKKYGVPFLSKYVSEMLNRLQKHGFKWENEPYESLEKKYPNCKSALKWWCNENKRHDGKIGFLNIGRNKWLKEFIILNPPTFSIGQKCCTYAKKNVSKEYNKNNNTDLQMVGIRKAEGGIRSKIYKTCFSEGEEYDNYRPIFWITDGVKQLYHEHYNVVNSRCYTDYGLTRTGCVGCPYNHDFEHELRVLQQYEPILYKVCMSIFGQSYNYTRRFRAFQADREKMF